MGFAVGGIFGWLPESLTGNDYTPIVVDLPENVQIATFAAGCFWCTESVYQEEAGVLDAVSGYAGGTSPDPTYEQVAGWQTDYRESVQITYDPEQVSYDRLLELFWQSIDPVDAWGQFTDRGYQYTTAIYWHDEEQEVSARDSLDAVQQDYDEILAPEILPYTTFTPAEDYHQDFYKYSAQRYQNYKKGSGRSSYREESGLNQNSDSDSKDSLLRSEWRSAENFQKPTKKELKDQLSFIQYRVSQKDGTEPPFANLYWDNKEEGLYVDIVSWEPMFSSLDKYKSGTWWPSFTQPIWGDESVVVLKEDTSLWMKRVEVRSVLADSHVGHLFDDGPVESWGLRYCMNSASMRFVPYEEMEELGYGDWKGFVK